jgi:SnoaL-like domain
MSLDDKDAIREVLAKYCTHGDNGRSKELAGPFTADGIWEGRMGRAEGRDAIEALVARINPPSAPGLVRYHIVTNSVVAIAGNTATVTSSFVMMRQAEQGPKIGAVGHYDDVFVEEERNWLIKTRKVTPDIMLQG